MTSCTYYRWRSGTSSNLAGPALPVGLMCEQDLVFLHCHAISMNHKILEATVRLCFALKRGRLHGECSTYTDDWSCVVDGFPFLSSLMQHFSDVAFPSSWSHLVSAFFQFYDVHLLGVFTVLARVNGKVATIFRFPAAGQIENFLVVFRIRFMRHCELLYQRISPPRCPRTERYCWPREPGTWFQAIDCMK